MTILDEGLNGLRDLFYDSVDTGELGTGTADVSATDTNLTTPDSTTITTLDKSKSDKSVKITYTLTSTSGTTATYTEFKTYDTSSSVDYDRILFTGVSFTKDGTEDLIIIKRYFFRSV